MTATIADLNALDEYLREHSGLELGRVVGGGTADHSPERGRVVAFVIRLLDAHMPDWLERQEGAFLACHNGNLEPLAMFAADVREVIETAAQLARKTGARPWEAERDMTADILRDRREHPEHWVPLAEAVQVYRRLARQTLGQRRAFARLARARGAGRPAGQRRKKNASDDSGGEGGEESDSERGAP